jgi:GTPase SAR1 family protein
MGLLSYLKSLGIGGTAKTSGRILMLGLDNSGKTSILKKLSNEDIMTVRPTAGFQIKELHHSELTLQVWDVGGNQKVFAICFLSDLLINLIPLGQLSLRPYWRNYFDAVDILVRLLFSFLFLRPFKDLKIGVCHRFCRS